MQHGDVTHCMTKIHYLRVKYLKACFKRRATALLSCSTVARLQHDTSTTWFQTSNLIQSNGTAAKVEFNSINLVRHGSSTTFETGLSKYE